MKQTDVFTNQCSVEVVFLLGKISIQYFLTLLILTKPHVMQGVPEIILINVQDCCKEEEVHKGFYTILYIAGRG